MRRTLAATLIAALIATVLAAGAPASGGDGDDVVVLAARPVVAGFGLRAQIPGLASGHAVGDVLHLGDAEYATTRLRGTLTVAVAPGKPPSKRLRKEGVVPIRVGEGRAARKVSVRFRPDGDVDDAWTYVMAEAHAVAIGDTTIELIDADADGRLAVDAGDAYRAPGAGVQVPLTATLLVGAQHVEIRSIAADSSTVHAVVTPVAGEPDQVAALALVNDMRLRHGLPGVTLDAELSAGCSAHASYLRKNKWSGYTNPHFEQEGNPGYSEAGASAGLAGAIMGASHPVAIHAFYVSYYHRSAFVSPYLERIGVSTGTPGISVVDAKSGTRDPTSDDTWHDPSMVPADGATRVPLGFCSSGEQPEPCEEPEQCGFPLTVLFAGRDHGVSGFAGVLERVDGKKPERVAALEPRVLEGASLFGLIPARPLAVNAAYRVTYTWTQDGDERTTTATFRTGDAPE